MTQLLDSFARIQSEEDLRNTHKILHSAESDLSWLHLADTCIAHTLDWPIHLLSTALLAGLRYLYRSDLERAKRMFVWCLQWAAKNEQSRTAMEAIRMHANHFDRTGDPTTAKIALQDAIQIAQETKDTLYLTGLHLDLAEHHLFNEQDRDAQITLQLIRAHHMSPAHGIRFLNLLGRIDVRAQRYQNAQEQFQKARTIALEEGLLRSATDLGLLRIQALLEAEELEEAIPLHKEIRAECLPFVQREEVWQNLKKEIIAKSNELR
jgi:tetratricopeptide (TPR) repeat protein